MVVTSRMMRTEAVTLVVTVVALAPQVVLRIILGATADLGKLRIEDLPCGMAFPHSLRDGVPFPAGGVPSPDLSQRERDVMGGSPKGEGCVGDPSPLGEVGRGQTLRSLISHLIAKISILNSQFSIFNPQLNFV